MRSYRENLHAPHGHAVAPGDASIEGCAGGSCGTLVRFLIQWESDGTVGGVEVHARGREAAVAMSSALAEALGGRDLVEAAALNRRDLHPDFAALTGEDDEQAAIAEDALHNALGDELLRRSHVSRKPMAARV